MVNHKLHPRIAEILRLFIDQLSEARQGLLEGFYLCGSIALGDYSIEMSDIDFVAFTNKRLSDSDVALIQSIHENVESRYRKPNLSGIYLSWDDMGQLPESIAPYPYYADGRMHIAGYYNLNLVTWFELKHYGKEMVGPPVAELDFEVDMEQLISRMRQNLNAYWTGWIRKSSRLYSPYAPGQYFQRTDVEWGVLGISRLFYTFREKNITTKAAAGHYALDVVPEKWHRIVEEAILIRRGVSKSLYRSKVKRKSEALAFMRYIQRECNSLFEGSSL
jgi:hypothetical protein